MAFLRLIALGILILGVIVGSSYAQPRWLVLLGMDFWELPALNKSLAEQQDRSEQIDEVKKEMDIKSKRKAQMIEDLLHQKISLRQAIAITRQTTEEEILNLILSTLGMDPENIGQEDTESAVGMVVIYWMRCELKNNPSLAVEICSQLENELSELKANCPFPKEFQKKSSELKKVVHRLFS